MAVSFLGPGFSFFFIYSTGCWKSVHTGNSNEHRQKKKKNPEELPVLNNQ